MHVKLTAVRDVAGVEPEDFATIARRYATRPEAQRTAGNLTRALWDFTLIGLTPTPRLDRLVRRQQHPVLLAPEYSATSATWKREHGAAVRMATAAPGVAASGATLPSEPLSRKR